MNISPRASIRSTGLILLTVLFPLITVTSAEELPRTLDERLTIQLFAESPQIVTPTGIDVDAAGRVWVIESNTHFPPDGYDRHDSDRILIMQDTTGDGRADRITPFTDGLTHAMSIAVRPAWMSPIGHAGAKSLKGVKSAGGSDAGDSDAGDSDAGDSDAGEADSGRIADSPREVFVATRRDIWLLTDSDGDLKMDQKRQLVRLDTPGNYPHNGLAGFAFDAFGWMYFGFGENLGAEYTIVGSDGTKFSGGGEGGNLYRCRPDGTELSQWATGFWNPHASTVDAFGRLFTVDNDPDSRPPCRLLHIIEGGDYGYRFSNGRKGLHPFTAWNGEIPGTLPMVSGTGEAPSAVVAYEAGGLPDEYRGDLLVTSWGDHRIDRFRLKPRGASFTAVPETIIQGDENFRPVGLATAPDGSLYCSDWVLRDYKIHGKGRIWRITGSSSSPSKRKPEPGADWKKLKGSENIGELKKAIGSKSLITRRVAARRLIDVHPRSLLNVTRDRKASERSRYEALMAMSRDPEDDWKRILKGYVPADQGPFDSVQTGLAQHFGEMPPLSRVIAQLDAEDGSDPNYLLTGLGSLTPLARVLGLSQSPAAVKLLSPVATSHDPFVISRMAGIMADVLTPAQLRKSIASEKEFPPMLRAMLVLAGRKRAADDTAVARAALERPEADVRRLAVQWAAEEKMTDLRPQVEAVLNDPAMTSDLFLATLAALEMLEGKSPVEFDKTPAGRYVLPLLKDGKRPAAVRAQALRLVQPDDPQLTDALLTELLTADDRQLKLETIRTLQQSTRPLARQLLSALASDVTSAVQLRAEAITGLAAENPLGETTRDLLMGMLNESPPELRVEALRGLRSAAGTEGETRKKLLRLIGSPGSDAPGVAEQLALIAGGRSAWSRRPQVWQDAEFFADADPQAGRRIFFHANSAGCFKCHTVNGRGGSVGPDLSRIARTMDRRKLAESILDPSREIAPQFTAWTFVMSSGKTHTGMILGDTRNNIQQIGTSDGKVLDLKATDIEQRLPQRTSIMPEKLIERLTAGEFRDLVAYLETLR